MPVRHGLSGGYRQRNENDAEFGGTSTFRSVGGWIESFSFSYSFSFVRVAMPYEHCAYRLAMALMCALKKLRLGTAPGTVQTAAEISQAKRGEAWR